MRPVISVRCGRAWNDSVGRRSDVETERSGRTTGRFGVAHLSGFNYPHSGSDSGLHGAKSIGHCGLIRKLLTTKTN